METPNIDQLISGKLLSTPHWQNTCNGAKLELSTLKRHLTTALELVEEVKKELDEQFATNLYIGNDWLSKANKLLKETKQ